MGSNSAIKHYELTPEGQAIELTDSQHSRQPIVRELLKSPWLVRASELLRREESWSAKRIEQAVDVVWDAQKRRPAGFVRAGRTWTIDAVIQTWSVERSWWDPRRRISRYLWRVVSRGGVYDLAFDRLEKTWFLLGIHD